MRTNELINTIKAETRRSLVVMTLLGGLFCIVIGLVAYAIMYDYDLEWFAPGITTLIQMIWTVIGYRLIVGREKRLISKAKEEEIK